MRRWALPVGTAALLASAVIFAGPPAVEWLSAREALAVTEVRLDGVERADAGVLEELAGVAAGDRWLTLDCRAVRFRLESHPWVHRARVRRPFPGRVVVLVQECRPLAVIHVEARPYGLCEDLRIVPLEGARPDLPVIRDLDSGLRANPDALARGMEYVVTLRERGIVGGFRLELQRDEGDVIVLPDRGFSARVAGTVAARRAAHNVVAFLETLDAQGGGRGTLRLISEGTAVWMAAT